MMSQNFTPIDLKLGSYIGLDSLSQRSEEPLKGNLMFSKLGFIIKASAYCIINILLQVMAGAVATAVRLRSGLTALSSPAAGLLKASSVSSWQVGS